MTGIIPLPDDYEIGNAKKELNENDGIAIPITLQGEFEDLLDGTSEEHREIVLDWAMEIRQKENLEWAECIRAASIFFFG